ncbi:GATA-type domain-containing protein [Hyphomicrobium sp. 1Nfss2.1]
MSNLIDLDFERKRRNHAQTHEQHEPEMWCCECGCITFYQWSTGAIQCAACKVVQNGFELPFLPSR